MRARNFSYINSISVEQVHTCDMSMSMRGVRMLIVVQQEKTQNCHQQLEVFTCASETSTQAKSNVLFRHRKQFQDEPMWHTLIVYYKTNLADLVTRANRTAIYSSICMCF